MKIVLIGGLCFAGKTYIANLLAKESEAYFKTSFANALKDELHNAGIIDKKLLKDKEYKSSVRHIMQQYGQQKRNADPFYWARIVEEKINDTTKDGITFIDDWRFKNEAQYFIDKGYDVKKTYVKRSDYYKLKSVGKATLDKYYLEQHQDESEQDLYSVCKEWIDGAPYFDVVYYNNNENDNAKIIKEWKDILKFGKVVSENAMQNW